jgi:predicted RNase H-like HicB family nuclease
MIRYTIIIEKAEGNYSAYCPDLPGCIATGFTPEETIQRMKDAIPESSTKAVSIGIAVNQ